MSKFMQTVIYLGLSCHLLCYIIFKINIADIKSKVRKVKVMKILMRLVPNLNMKKSGLRKDVSWFSISEFNILSLYNLYKLLAACSMHSRISCSELVFCCLFYFSDLNQMIYKSWFQSLVHQSYKSLYS